MAIGRRRFYIVFRSSPVAGETNQAVLVLCNQMAKKREYFGKYIKFDQAGEDSRCLSATVKSG